MQKILEVVKDVKQSYRKILVTVKMSSSLLLSQEGFNQYPSTIKRIAEQKTPTLASLSPTMKDVEEPLRTYSPKLTSSVSSGRIARADLASIKIRSRSTDKVVTTVKTTREEEIEVEAELLSAGLEPREQVMMRMGNGDVVRYSKCSDIHGNLCLIDHDGDGHIKDHDNDSIVRNVYELQDISDVSHSLKNQVCDMSKKNGCALSIASNQGFYITHQHEQEAKELYLSRVHHQCQKGQVCNAGVIFDSDIELNNIVIIPVFKFSEVKKNKDYVCKKIVEMALHALCLLNRLAEEKNKELLCTLTNIGEKWKKYLSVRECVARKLHDKMRKVEVQLKELECSKQFECNKDKYEQLKKEYACLLMEYAKFDAILLTSHKLLEYAKDIEHIVDDNICKMSSL